ncbi:Serine/threonine protein phosphatase 2C [Mycena indigotica]|uniref:Serine/threonine protein phosphatase 2C n=1 Tax=Mycena indigotica TaxID=2126181 RepID=A0A8H6TA27_9AGAR|nr:Serine/threonine protein phosphatase 2C [Mycena indigotica]KAF7314945.1 Serine/threonine protein phosphatase 2C [Mycena indigotica]
MASRFRRLRFPLPSRFLLGLSISTGGLYLAAKQRELHADSRPPLSSVALKSSNEAIPRSELLVANSNLPAEDYVCSLPMEPYAWRFYGVFDGHNGHHCAAYLSKNLLRRMNDALWQEYLRDEKFSLKDIYRTIKETFLAVDNEIVNSPAQRLRDEPSEAPIRTLAANTLQEARSGASAIFCFYQGNIRKLHIAVVGDCRAILGRRRKTDVADAPPMYDVHILSVDQTPDNPAEVARLKAAHPHEPHLFRDGSFLGWGITRAFGTGAMKWSREMQDWMERKAFGLKYRSVCQSPPYFTAEPEITTTTVEPGDFMIMASDGFWECLTNEEAVGLVGKWLEVTGGPLPGRNDMPSEDWVVERQDLPVEITDGRTHYQRWGVKKKFVCYDINASEHLARNALGGANKDVYNALLDLPPPHSRLLRDDISLAVVFFS